MSIPDEYSEYLMCLKFHKLPHEFDSCSANMVELWHEFQLIESEAEEVERKRQSQKTHGR